MTISSTETRFLTHAHAAWLNAAMYGAVAGAVASLAYLALYLNGLIAPEVGMIVVTCGMLAAMAVGGLRSKRDNFMPGHYGAVLRGGASLAQRHSSEPDDVVRAVDCAKQLRSKLDTLLAEYQSSKMSLAEASRLIEQIRGSGPSASRQEVQSIFLRLVENAAAHSESGSLQARELQELAGEVERQLTGRRE